MALLVLIAPAVAGQLSRPEVFPGVPFPFTSAVLASALACVLLAAGGLYTLWTEK